MCVTSHHEDAECAWVQFLLDLSFPTLCMDFLPQSKHMQARWTRLCHVSTTNFLRCSWCIASFLRPFSLSGISRSLWSGLEYLNSSQTINPTCFIDTLTFPLAPPWGWHVRKCGTYIDGVSVGLWNSSHFLWSISTFTRWSGCILCELLISKR